MSISVVGNSHAPQTFRQALAQRDFVLCSTELASLVIIAEDTPTDDAGRRDMRHIGHVVAETMTMVKDDACILITSQLSPGLTRVAAILHPNHAIYHMSETLRIKDALERALRPEQIILGCADPLAPLHPALLEYVIPFNCPVWQLTYEEAEFSKIAINMTLAAQVDNTNRLAKAAAKIGADWDKIATVLKHDRRIGPHSYLTPGDWKESRHLLRDSVTLNGYLQD